MTHAVPRRRLAPVFAPVFAAALVALTGVAPQPSPPSSTDAVLEPGISRPTEEAKPTFAAPGLVAEVLVHEGDAVKQGQVLARQDDRQEQQTLRSDRADAESVAEIEYEAADAAQKQVQYQRKQTLYDQQANPDRPDDHLIAASEVEEAKLAVALSKAQGAVSQLTHEKKGYDYERQKIKVEQMALRAPFDGIVEKISVHAGEMSDPQSKDGVLTVVRNDPLKVVVHPSTDRALKLQMGQELQVRYAAPAGFPANPWMTAAIYYFAPQADASSKTEELWLRLPNGAGQRSGLAVEVRLPADVAAVATGGGAVGAAGVEPLLPPPR